jgi:dihydroorotate dehydrogenase electron transfer subunit
MMQALCLVQGVSRVADNIFVLRFTSSAVSKTVRAGQFVNMRTGNTLEPLLRRPFSVYRTEGDDVEIIFNVVGRGTAALSRKHEGDRIDVLGPLGVPFTLDADDFQTAVLIGGGLGVAPLPIATTALRTLGKSILTLLGSRSSTQLVENHLENLRVATDDGTRGYKGNVVELAEKILSENAYKRPKLFACGPTAMLRSLADLARRMDLPCEVSLEGAMGCGFGICQGCPVELVDSDKKYALMCKDGPTFDVRRIKI